MRHTAMAIVVVGIVAASAFLLAGGGAALQEPRPLDLLLTAIRIEVNGPDAREIPQAMDQPSRWLQRARDEPAERDGLSRDFAVRGWTFAEQLGGLRVYARDGLRMRLVCRMIGRRYQLCEAEGRP